MFLTEKLFEMLVWRVSFIPNFKNLACTERVKHFTCIQEYLSTWDKSLGLRKHWINRACIHRMKYTPQNLYSKLHVLACHQLTCYLYPPKNKLTPALVASRQFMIASTRRVVPVAVILVTYISNPLYMPT